MQWIIDNRNLVLFLAYVAVIVIVLLWLRYYYSPNRLRAPLTGAMIVTQQMRRWKRRYRIAGICFIIFLGMDFALAVAKLAGDPYVKDASTLYKWLVGGTLLVLLITTYCGVRYNRSAARVNPHTYGTE